MRGMILFMSDLDWDCSDVGGAILNNLVLNSSILCFKQHSMLTLHKGVPSIFYILWGIIFCALLGTKA